MELALTPAGRIIVVDDADGVGNARAARLAKTFAANQGEALFLLAAERADGVESATELYWRRFAETYLTALCHIAEATPLRPGLIALPPADELDERVLDAPPMRGGEYLNVDCLGQLWQELDGWIIAAIDRQGEGASGFLKRRAPLWHHVGRVCFHLAENRRDEQYPFAFLATYAPKVAGGTRVQYQPLGHALRELAGARNRATLLKLLSPVQKASERSALARELVESRDIYQPLAWTPHEAYRFLKDVPIFEESGIVVRMPDWWKKRPRPRVGVTIGDARQKTLDMDAMLDFKIGVALDDGPLSKAEISELLQGEDGLVLLRGQWVEVDRGKLKEALDHWRSVEAESAAGVSFLDGMRMLAGLSPDAAEPPADEDRPWAFVHAGKWLGEVLSRLRHPEQVESAAESDGLAGTLRPYQQTGFQWLKFVSGLGLGACLADDMGLGKTIQVLALFLALKRQRTARPSLLVLPASLLGNWKAEIARFAPSLKATFLHPAEMGKDELDRLSKDEGAPLAGYDVVATTYGMLLRQPWLSKSRWRLVVLDEAQAIKNPAARQTRAVKQLKADARIALTGTPVENRLADLWSLFDFLCPGLLGSQNAFKQLVKRLNERQENRYGPLRNLVQPYILRRMKTDRRIIDDLPEKVEVQAYCSLSRRQAALYASLVEELAELLKQPASGIRRRGLVLAYLMRFKQLCNHPSQLSGDGRFDPAESGKFTRLAEICDEVASRQEKALVFTQFREMTEPVASFLAGIFGRAGLVLHGETAVGRRKALVDQFQRDDGPPFFVLSLKAGGTGLNLTAASHVIHFDRWWNPAVENQATDRAFRIGQRRNVLVHKFVCRGTIEERIDALIEDKRQLASDLLEGGAERLLTEMPDDELIRFVSLDVTRACE